MKSPIELNSNEIQIKFIRSSGPGGQNVNKVSTAVQVSFDVHNSYSLPPHVKYRLIKIAGQKITKDGMLIITSQTHRSQDQNRKEALNRLRKLVEKAYEKPKLRHKTKPTAGSKRRRLDKKKKRGQIKKSRRFRPNLDD